MGAVAAGDRDARVGSAVDRAPQSSRPVNSPGQHGAGETEAQGQTGGRTRDSLGGLPRTHWELLQPALSSPLDGGGGVCLCSGRAHACALTGSAVKD